MERNTIVHCHGFVDPFFFFVCESVNIQMAAQKMKRKKLQSEHSHTEYTVYKDLTQFVQQLNEVTEEMLLLVKTF